MAGHSKWVITSKAITMPEKVIIESMQVSPDSNYSIRFNLKLQHFCNLKELLTNYSL